MSEFPCSICKIDKSESERMKLKCGHIFCWQCMNTYLKKNLQPKIKCPVAFCYDMIRDGQIRRVLCEDDIETYEKLCTASLSKTHKCLLKQCSSKLMYTDSNVQYECPTCTLYNCIKCNAAHMFTNCATYQSKTEAEKALICQNEIQRAEQIFDAKMGEKNRLNLLEWDAKDILQNYEVFTCSICMLDIGKGKGVKLQNCDHNICKDCLKRHVTSGLNNCNYCPICNVNLDDSDCRGLLSKEEMLKYDEFMIRNVLPKFERAARCHFADCPNVVDISGKLTKWKCELCKNMNCLKCKAIHGDGDCANYKKSQKEYQDFIDFQYPTETSDQMNQDELQTRLGKTYEKLKVDLTKCKESGIEIPMKESLLKNVTDFLDLYDSSLRNKIKELHVLHNMPNNKSVSLNCLCVSINIVNLVMDQIDVIGSSRIISRLFSYLGDFQCQDKSNKIARRMQEMILYCLCNYYDNACQRELKLIDCDVQWRDALESCFFQNQDSNKIKLSAAIVLSFNYHQMDPLKYQQTVQDYLTNIKSTYIHKETDKYLGIRGDLIAAAIRKFPQKVL